MKKPLRINIHLVRLLVALIAAAFSFVFLWQISQNRYDIQTLEESRLLERYANNLSAEFDRAFISVQVLGALAPETPQTEQDFQRIATSLFGQLSGVLSLQLAPNAVVTYLYPDTREAGVPGNNLLRNPLTERSARQAIRQRQMIIDGPRPLQQGGQGIIARLPIFIDGEFWGFSTAVFRLDALLERVELDALAQQGYAFGLAVKTPDNIVPVVGSLSKDDFTEQAHVRQVSIAVANQTWLLAVAPKGITAWLQVSWLEIALAVWFVLLTSALASSTIQVFIHRNYLNELVGEQTRDIEQRELKLNQAQKVGKIGSWHMNIGEQTRILSRQAMRVLGISEMKQNLPSYFSQVLPEYRPLIGQFLTGESLRTIEYQVNTAAGERCIREVAEFDGQQLVGTIQDVTQEKRDQAIIWRQANIDGLTGLPNLSYAKVLIHRYIDQHRAPSLLFALFDIQQFKAVNDGFGQTVGDELLQSVAKRLSAQVEPCVLISRFAADVFLIVIDDDYYQQDLVAQVEQMFATSVAIQEAERFVGFHIGLAKLPDHGVEVDELIRRADIALHAAKLRSSQIKHCWFDEQQLLSFLQQDELDADLRVAIQNDQLFMVYQPIVDAKSHCIVGAEALVRWQHPVKGLIRPDHFIARAEHNGMIFALGREIIRQVARDSRQFANSALGAIPLSINISRTQFFDDGFSEFLSQQLQERFAPGQAVTMEVTESFELTDYDALKEVIDSVKYEKIQWALDDFGTGYSSYSAIGMLPIDNIKIDQSFIRDLEQHQVNQAIVANIISMAHTLAKTVTAEGVETQAQCQLLASMGCDYLQGYYFFKPLQPEALIAQYAQS